MQENYYADKIDDHKLAVNGALYNFCVMLEREKTAFEAELHWVQTMAPVVPERVFILPVTFFRFNMPVTAFYP